MTSSPLPDIVTEARRVIAAGEARDVPIRLIGGVAIRIRADGTFQPALARAYKDIDLVTLKGRTKVVAALLEELGYEPHRTFNGINGHERLLFFDTAHGRQLDVFVGAFRMCHEVPIEGRAMLDPATVPLAELLLTKLQIFSLNEKDLRDAIAILSHHEVGDRDGDTINAGRVAELCADDWGLWRTCKLNVGRVREGVGDYDLGEGGEQRLLDRLDRLWARIEAEPKSRGWRLRDRVGDRKQWYTEPEEVG